MREWLEERLAVIPTELAGAVRDLMRGCGWDEPTPERMARCALETFERVASTSQTRTGALELLAADAVLTYAFESVSDPQLGGSATAAMALAHAWGPSGEIGRRAAEVI